MPPRRRARPDFWPDETGTAPYTNALILNGKVLVPLFGIDTDEAALATWREAMPGYRVIGYPYDDWRSFDALHCRTRAIFDPRMIRIRHVPVSRTAADAADRAARTVPIVVRAAIDDYSGQGFAEPGPEVVYRYGAESTWRSVPLRGLAAGEYEAELHDPPDGAEIEYYLRVVGSSGRRVVLPAAAPGVAFRVGSVFREPS